VGTPEPTDQLALSYVIPAYNSSDAIEATLKELGDRLHGTHSEILVVENGSTDDSPELLAKLQREWQFEGVELRVLHSEKGLGNALKLGIGSSRGSSVVLSADDLPFGFDDLDEAQKIGLNKHKVIIGSKAHPKSDMDRTLLRAVLSTGFLVLRWLILGMKTRDPQGTFVLDGTWARGVVGKLTAPGFLLTTELVYLAELEGNHPVEVPVKLRRIHTGAGSTIRVFHDAYSMGIGLFKIRKLHRKTHGR